MGQSHWLCPLIPTIIPSSQGYWEYMDWNKPLLCVSPVSLNLLSVIHCRCSPPPPLYSQWFSINSLFLVFIFLFLAVFVFLWFCFPLCLSLSHTLSLSFLQQSTTASRQQSCVTIGWSDTGHLVLDPGNCDKKKKSSCITDPAEARVSCLLSCYFGRWTYYCEILKNELI